MSYDKAILDFNYNNLYIDRDIVKELGIISTLVYAQLISIYNKYNEANNLFIDDYFFVSYNELCETTKLTKGQINSAFINLQKQNIIIKHNLQYNTKLIKLNLNPKILNKIEKLKKMNEFSFYTIKYNQTIDKYINNPIISIIYTDILHKGIEKYGFNNWFIYSQSELAKQLGTSKQTVCNNYFPLMVENKLIETKGTRYFKIKIVEDTFFKIFNFDSNDTKSIKSYLNSDFNLIAYAFEDNNLKLEENYELEGEYEMEEDLKYEILDITKEYNGHILHRIKRLSDGKIGGWIESEENLSHDGTCWIDDNAIVYGFATVDNNAQVYNNAIILDAYVAENAKIYNNASILGYSDIHGNAQIYGNAEIIVEKNNNNLYDDVNIYDNAQIYGNAKIKANNYLSIYNNAQIYDNATIYGEMDIYENAQIYGNANIEAFCYSKICGNANIYDDAIIDTDYIEISGNTKIYENAHLEWVKIYGNVEIYGQCKLNAVELFDNVKICGNTYIDVSNYEIMKIGGNGKIENIKIDESIKN